MMEDQNSSILNSTVVDSSLPLGRGIRRPRSEEQTSTPAKRTNISIVKITGANLNEKSQIKLKKFFLNIDTSLNQETIKIHQGYSMKGSSFSLSRLISIEIK